MRRPAVQIFRSCAPDPLALTGLGCRILSLCSNRLFKESPATSWPLQQKIIRLVAAVLVHCLALPRVALPLSLSLDVCVYIYIYKRLYVCVYIYIYTYIHVCAARRKTSI